MNVDKRPFDDSGCSHPKAGIVELLDDYGERKRYCVLCGSPVVVREDVPTDQE